MLFTDGDIDGVLVREVTKHSDHRGWLTEVFRDDELENYMPVMCYVSLTEPGISRGPHEHHDQTDYFVFTGPGDFEIHLWDHRKNSPTFGNHRKYVGGDVAPLCLIVPPGIVHGYKNISQVQGLVINCPDRLFAGKKRSDPIDETRHEDNPQSIFRM
jgi:dTDP-4-dehydrorhamnose 3,5-epimerase